MAKSKTNRKKTAARKPAKNGKAGPKSGKKAKPGERLIHNEKWIDRHIESFSKEIAESDVLDHALIVGIRRRGAELARRVRSRVHDLAGVKVPLGALDVTLYRDDMAMRGPKIRTQKDGTRLDAPIDNKILFLIDDVVCTGRTIRAALSEIMDFGRPGAVKLFSLIDRGGRELPIQPDKVGERMRVSMGDRVDVRLKETDGEEGVFVVVGGLR